MATPVSFVISHVGGLVGIRRPFFSRQRSLASIAVAVDVW